ncbi:hypothetical protein V8C34DRAFT_321653 [Trichoderma compactum]
MVVEKAKGKQAETRVEDYPRGYPRFSALLAAEKTFQICRRFSTLRTRLLLQKQDKLSQLEQELEEIDDKDKSDLDRGSYRFDENPDRKEVLQKIDAALRDYDKFLERHQRAFTFENSPNSVIQDLQQWLHSNPDFTRHETDYVYRNDLFSFTEHISWAEKLLSLTLSKVVNKFGNVEYHGLSSKDPNVKIAGRPSRKAARILLAPFIAALLLTPVIVCNYVKDLTHRVVIVVLTTAVFIAALGCITKVKAVEWVVAGATYATVLVVFISGTNGNGLG